LGFALCACGGSGSHAPLPASSSPSTTPIAPQATAKLTFTIPARTPSAVKRKPAFISTSATQLSVTAVNTLLQSVTSNPQLTADCIAQPDGTRACTVPVGSPTGSVTFAIALEDASSNTIAFGTNATPATITEGQTNAVPFITLDPVPASMSFAVPAIHPGSTTAVQITQSYSDDGGAAITGSEPLVSQTGSPLTLTLTAVGTVNGAFSTSPSCAPAATSFPNWTSASPLYFCPNGSATIGTAQVASLSGVVAPIFAQRQYPPSVFSTWQSFGTLLASSVTSISGNDSDAVYAVGYCCSIPLNQRNIAEASYNNATLWPQVGYAGFDLYPAYQTPGAGYIMASWIDQGNGPGQWAFSPTAYLNSEFNVGTPITHNVVALSSTDQTGIPGQVYAAETDDSTTGNVDQIVWIGGMPSPRTGVLTLPNFPHSVAIGLSPYVYVGFSNNGSVGVLNSDVVSNHVLSGPVVLAPVDPGYTGSVVAGNAAVACAVAYGAGKAIEVYSMFATTATKVATLASVSDQLAFGTIGTGAALTDAYDVAVGTDGRCYIVVKNGATSRVIAYDPVSNTIVDPAINVSSLDATRPIMLSPGQSGSMLVAGTLSSDLDIGVEQYP
jgi:hypothetical protein